jgi:hypothetical protein
VGAGKFANKSAKAEGIKFLMGIVFILEGIYGIYQVACLLAIYLKI